MARAARSSLRARPHALELAMAADLEFDAMGRDATRRDSRASELSMLTAHDIYLFREGTHGRLYQGMGCHLVGNDGGEGGASGASFAVWAPTAARISVVGEFNGWESTAHPMQARADGSGVWERFVTGVEHGQNYKYRVISAHGASAVDKADPYAFFTEVAPSTASSRSSLPATSATWDSPTSS